MNETQLEQTEVIDLVNNLISRIETLNDEIYKSENQLQSLQTQIVSG